MCHRHRHRPNKLQQLKPCTTHTSMCSLTPATTTKFSIKPTSSRTGSMRLCTWWCANIYVWKEVPRSITPKEELAERWTCKIYSPAAAGTFMEDWWKKKRAAGCYRQKMKRNLLGGEELMTHQRWKRLRRRQGLKSTAAKCQILVNVTFDI